MSKLSVLVLALVSLGACGNAGPHEIGTCDEGWTRNGFEQCEKACEASGTALGASGPACTALTEANVRVVCQRTLEYDGIAGCCITDGTAGTSVRFAECEE